MRMPNSLRRTPRHPAVIDLLDSAPTTSPAMPSTLAAPAVPGPPAPPRGGGRGRWRPGRTTVVVAAAAVAVVGGAVAVGQVIAAPTTDQTEVVQTPAALGPTDEAGLPVLNLPEETTTEVAEDPESTSGECRADRGDQRSGAGVIAAFNHAYYTRRDAVAARALATETSTVAAAPELQGFIDELPPGTSYCLRTVELSAGVYLVDLSVMRPDVPVERGTQTVTTVKVDGRWYVDVFK